MLYDNHVVGLLDEAIYRVEHLRLDCTCTTSRPARPPSAPAGSRRESWWPGASALLAVVVLVQLGSVRGARRTHGVSAGGAGAGAEDRGYVVDAEEIVEVFGGGQCGERPAGE
ncbi:hypothetical protein ACFVZH_38320 [Streptomyces sp. NPDC059534]|uniref:hypothetical protein n=1 Tax=Streptomyces sp. NPDC059534 TaxID=3346859 RepID=UPI0036C99C10